jgi:fumarate reductase flavoprotein subunit
LPEKIPAACTARTASAATGSQTPLFLSAWLKAYGAYHEPDVAAIDAAVARCRAPLARPPGDINAIREQLYDLMWDEVGILRNAAGLRRAEEALDELDARLDEIGVPAGELAFNLTWHEWLNLKSLILVSKAIRFAAMAREDSRGAHFREDFPEVRDLENSRFTAVTLHETGFDISMQPVHFTRVRPGETLLKESALTA